MTLSALQFEQQYRNLSVSVGDGQSVFVVISHYRNNSSTSDDHSTVSAKENAMRPLVSALRAQSKKDLGLKKTPTGSNIQLKRPGAEPDVPLDNVDVVSIVRTFVGKGSPADIAGTLALAVRFEKVEGTTTALQKYVDKYVGLDCSGFVSNYLNIAYDAKIDVMNKSSISFRSPDINRYGKLDEIESRSIIAFSQTNHVALLEAVDLDWLRLVANKSTDGDLTDMQVTVVESNGSRGLNHSTYTVKSVDSHKVFKVKRSYQAKIYPVYILKR